MQLLNSDLTGFKKMAFGLALSGIIPFLICTLAIFFKLNVTDTWLKILLAYAVIILAFLGGVHWGVAIGWQKEQPQICFGLLIEGVLAVILGWLLLLLDSVHWQLNGFIVLYLSVLLLDAGLSYWQIIPKWFLGLRSLITVLVVILLIVVKLVLN